MFLLKELLQGLLVLMGHILGRDLQVPILSGPEVVITHQAFGFLAVWRLVGLVAIQSLGRGLGRKPL
ncbi:hypothetical protein A6D70_29745 [Klebsiella pneumoniae]|nr:hypothetical protein A6D70_29745 [Klebsiella pneumoniae]